MTRGRPHAEDRGHAQAPPRSHRRRLRRPRRRRRGVVGSDHRSLEPVPVVADTGALAAECARPLPNPVSGTPATFLRLDGIKGESTNHQHWQESEVDQFRIGFGAPGGRRPLVLTKPYDKASPLLLAAAGLGREDQAADRVAAQGRRRLPALLAQRRDRDRRRAHRPRRGGHRAPLPGLRVRARSSTARSTRRLRSACRSRRSSE